MKIKTISLIICMFMLLSITAGCSKPSDSEDTPDIPQSDGQNIQQEKFSRKTELIGSGEDKVNIMIYMCASELESINGFATLDLNEICAAQKSDKVNIIIQTGGTSKWTHSAIENGMNMIYEVKNGELTELLSEPELKDMSKPETLSSFIKFCSEKYEANRNILVLWGHGGGAVGGFGNDEVFTHDSMSLQQLNSALSSSGELFDFIAFDCPLMSGLETAGAVADYSDYMLASETFESFVGIDYSKMIDKLSENTSVPTTELLESVINEYYKNALDSYSSDTVNMTSVDLSQIKYVNSCLDEFAAQMSEKINSGDFAYVSKARAKAYECGSRAGNSYDIVDLTSLADFMNIPAGENLKNAVKTAVRYSRSNADAREASGLSVFFPYSSLNEINEKMTRYYSTGLIPEKYKTFLNDFISVMLCGQYILANGEENITQADFYQYSWFSKSAAEKHTDYIKNNLIDQSSLKLTDENDKICLLIDENILNKLSTAQQIMLGKNDENTVVLGYRSKNAPADKVYADKYRDWVKINGRLCAYYAEAEVKTYRTGIVPVIFNKENKYLIMEYNEIYPEGHPVGCAEIPDGLRAAAKGYLSPTVGDTINYVFSRFSGGRISDSVETINDSAYTIDKLMESEFSAIKGYTPAVTFLLRDIFMNTYCLQPSDI